MGVIVVFETAIQRPLPSTLKELRSLRRLTLVGTPLTTTGVESLRLELPQCEIHHSPPQPGQVEGTEPAAALSDAAVGDWNAPSETCRTESDRAALGDDERPHHAGHFTKARRMLFWLKGSAQVWFREKA